MLVGLSILLLTGLAVFWLSLVLWTAWLLTFPPRRTYAWAVARGVPGDPSEVRLGSRREGEPAVDVLAYSALSIGVADGVGLAAWDIQGGNPSGPTIIVSHGWGDSRVVMLSRLTGLWRPASRLILYDSRGHGDSGGACALGTREVEDLLTVIRHVRETGPRKALIVLYGFSLGAGVSIAAAARDGAINAVIAEAPYRVPITPARNVLASKAMPHRATLAPAMALVGLWRAGTLAWAWAGPAAGFDRAALAAAMPPTTRLLVLHGSEDRICPIDDARAIAKAGRGELRIISGAEHTSLWAEPVWAAQCSDAVDSLLAGLGASTDGTLPISGDTA